MKTYQEPQVLSKENLVELSEQYKHKIRVSSDVDYHIKTPSFKGFLHFRDTTFTFVLEWTQVSFIFTELDELEKLLIPSGLGKRYSKCSDDQFELKLKDESICYMDTEEIAEVYAILSFVVDEVREQQR